MNREERIKYLQEHQDEVWELARKEVADATDVELRAFEVLNKGNRLLFNEPEIIPEQWYHDRIMDQLDSINYNHCPIIGNLDIGSHLEKIRYDYLCEHEIFLYIKDDKVLREIIFDGNSLRVNNDDEYKLDRLKEAKALNAGLYIVHNHPLEFAVKPSKGDGRVARFVKEKADELGVELLDVAIVSLDDYYSFKQDKQID